MRTPARSVRTSQQLTSFPAPVGGWIANINLATPNARRPDGSPVNGAAMLENWFPTATGVRMRGGSSKYATIGAGSLDVKALFSYITGGNRKLFGATNTDIYDITTVADPAVSPASAVSAMDNSGGISVVQFATAGGTFLRLVNGADTPRVYDGSTWGTTPTITGVTATTLSHVWAWKQRLFFIQKDTLDAWYLPVDSIGGAAVKLPLGGVFNRGGSLLFGSSWSLDENSGLSASCVFVTTEGEVAVYRGSDPSSASTWALVGVYRIGRPRGPKAFIRAGGDLVIATDIGAVPLSQAIAKDFVALSPNAVSYSIEDEWNNAVADRSGGYWECEVWPTKQMVLVSLYQSTNLPKQIFVCNARTGAWALYTGWDSRCVHAFGERCFFGSASGKVIECEVTGADQGATYTANCVPLFDPLKSPASLKTGLMARSVLRSPANLEARLSLQMNFNIVLPPAPDDIAVIGTEVWGTAVWGSSMWGTEQAKTTYQKWRSISGSGTTLSVATQVTSGSIMQPNFDLVQTDLTFEIGEVGS